MAGHHFKKYAKSIPHLVWPASALRDTEKQAADSVGVTLYELMQRAGQAAFDVSCHHYPDARHWLILCGAGNNGGDGYVVARLCHAAGIRVTLLAQESSKPLPEEANLARQAWFDVGGISLPWQAPWPESIDLVIDGLSGIGLTDAPRDDMASLIALINAHPAPVIALDIPSGLLAETGATPGAVVEATHCVTFIALKPGLLTGKARDVVGQLHYAGLGLSSWLQQHPPSIMRFDSQNLTDWLKPRRPTSHKGDNGRLVIIGGDSGTAGAIRLTGEASVRSGAGLVRVLTRAENITPLLTARPELMVHELTPESLEDALAWADVIAIGPGLGQQQWGRDALERVKESDKPMLWDADALNLLAISPDKRQNRIITPHPGEAARLLQCSVSQIERDRLLSARELVKQYGGVVVLKGAGTIVASEHDLAIIDVGNAGMGSGGMGDVLSGVIAALLAQQLTLFDAASAGCVAHGSAADVIAEQTGMRGMLASDLFSKLYLFINPDLNT
ncbi:bifunctional ADP-dependent NAD(P)H-hydrate dehydratase/NAD(P)H-hydrate epimerase [uncultured Cedecea sp.]|uniref:bifunctional ADP-dependent NAD(P)H-hydrate dehydratase/NAD(P)H-hydrate epimerase n=1 Tax=uncultured Cedecea sp. TaxID=988762 RepID=UPI002638A59D|nr:bifunctional ADP-dependent NAD(P)H-hydrate dehydratase/NAD(P)H-hydrate epimerase [uncultured Cedecea sp.]